MMMTNPKKAVSVILSRVSPSVESKKEMKSEGKSLLEKLLASQGGEEKEGEADPSESLRVAASAFVEAVHSKDIAATAAAFKEMFKACELAPHEEYEEEDEDELGFDSY